jgi:hypothetical protein
VGDPNRFKITAEFIRKNFKPCTVADVAGGKGLLSLELAKFGFDCTVIETNPRPQNHSIKNLKGKFTPQMAANFDLVVGLHPDQATHAICESAKAGHKVVLVPCCFYWQGINSHGDISHTIRKYLAKYKIPYFETQLKMNGKNLVFVIN